jgi:hypothetical protein
MKTIHLLTATCVLSLTASSSAEAAPLPPVKDNGFTGPVHEQYAGKFFFSKSKVSKTPAPKDFADSFRLEDPLFLRIFLAKSWENLVREKGVKCQHRLDQPARQIAVSVNGGEEVLLDNRKTHEDGFASGTYYVANNDWQKPVNAGPTEYAKDAETPYLKWAAAVVPELEVGDNSIVFTAYAVCRVANKGASKFVAATGTISLSLKSAKARDTWIAKHGPRLPRSRFPNGSALHAHMKKAIESRFKGEETQRAMVITSKGWEIKRDRISGVALSRRLTSLVILESATHGCRGFDLSFTQQSLDGRARYGDDMSISVGASHRLPCSTK